MIRIIRKLLNIIFSTEAIGDCHPSATKDFLHRKAASFLLFLRGLFVFGSVSDMCRAVLQLQQKAGSPAHT